MFKDYIFYNGKAIITDDKLHKNVVDHYDNLDEVLKYKNMILEIESRQSRIKEEIEKIELIPDNKIILPVKISLILTILSTFLLFNMNYTVSLILFNLFSSISLITSSNLYFKNKKNNRIYSGKLAEYNYLTEQNTKYKEIIDDLEKNLSSSKGINGFEIHDIDNKELLERLKKYLELYYKFGYNKDKYHKYDRYGNIDKKLKREYNDEEIEEVKIYLKKYPKRT